MKGQNRVPPGESLPRGVVSQKALVSRQTGGATRGVRIDVQVVPRIFRVYAADAQDQCPNQVIKRRLGAFLAIQILL